MIMSELDYYSASSAQQTLEELYKVLPESPRGIVEAVRRLKEEHMKMQKQLDAIKGIVCPDED